MGVWGRRRVVVVWWWWWTVVVGVLLVRGTQWTQAQDTCVQCDCRLSSGEEDERAIFNLKSSSRCLAGSLLWSSAYNGAVRLEVQPFQRHPYRLCFVVTGHHTLAQVSLEEVPSLQQQQQEQQQHLQGHQDLVHNHRLHKSSEVERSPHIHMRQLVSTGPGKEEQQSGEVCVLARARWPVVLFLEVQRNNEFSGVPSVLLQYDVERLSGTGDGASAGAVEEAVLADPMEECRPCTQEELLEAYCTSDFVAVGSIQQAGLAPDQDQGRHHGGDLVTHLEVAAVQLIHQNTPVFSRHRREDRHLQGTITAPSKCGIRPTTPSPGKGGGGAGGGDYLLFTGRMRLGKAKLRCAPYFQDWLRISHLAECVYD